VGSYPAGASPYGVMDMAGNVTEWVKDWWQSDYYTNSPPNNPPGPTVGPLKILRGGSWSQFWYFTRVTDRNLNRTPDFRGNHVGFRCVDSPVS
jgi:formylglycine-generating enzyme